MNEYWDTTINGGKKKVMVNEKVTKKKKGLKK